MPVILPPVVNKKIVYDELQAIWRDAWLAKPAPCLRKFMLLGIRFRPKIFTPVLRLEAQSVETRSLSDTDLRSQSSIPIAVSICAFPA